MSKHMLGCQCCCQWHHCIFRAQWSKWGETLPFVCVMLWPQCWNNMVPINGIEKDFILFLRARNWNLLQLGHFMPLALVHVSHDADGIINDTIPFLVSIWSKWGTAWLFGHVLPLALTLAACDADSIVNGTIAFIRSGTIKMRCNMTFLPMPCYWHWSCNHKIPSSVSKESLHSLHQANQNEDQHNFFGYVTQLPLP